MWSVRAGRFASCAVHRWTPTGTSARGATGTTKWNRNRTRARGRDCWSDVTAPHGPGPGPPVQRDAHRRGPHTVELERHAAGPADGRRSWPPPALLTTTPPPRPPARAPPPPPPP